MAIRVNWDGSDKTTVRYDFPATWTWAMFSDAMSAYAALVRGKGDDVNFIFDLTRTEKMPEGAAFHLRNAIARAPRIGFIVVASPSPSVHNAFNLLGDLDPTLSDRVIPVRGVEAARSVLSHPYSLRTPVSPASVER